MLISQLLVGEFRDQRLVRRLSPDAFPDSAKGAAFYLVSVSSSHSKRSLTSKLVLYIKLGSYSLCSELSVHREQSIIEWLSLRNKFGTFSRPEQSPYSSWARTFSCLPRQLQAQERPFLSIIPKSRMYSVNIELDHHEVHTFHDVRPLTR